MPQVTMPDGTVVEMPENPSPELQARLQRFISDYNAKAVAGKPKAEPKADADTKPVTSPATDDGMRALASQAPEVGAAEAGMNVLSGMIAAPAGGLTGIGAAVGKMLGLTKADPAEVVRKVQETLTYQPRSELGQRLVKTLGIPFEKLAEVADTAGQKTTDVTGSPALGAAVNTGIQSIPLIAGKLAPRVSAKLQVMEDAAAQQRAKIAALQAPAQDGLDAAQKAGLMVTPSQGNAGTVLTSVEGLAGEPKLAKAMSKHNAGVINDLARRDLGLPDDVPVTRDVTARIRAQAGDAYEAVKNAGPIEADPTYFSALKDITKSYDTAAKDFAHRSENPFSKVIEGLTKDTFDASSAVEEVKLLRQDADRAFANRDKGLGRAYRQMAQAVDDLIDRNLTLKSSGAGQGLPGVGVDPEAVANYRAARKLIAKTYLADSAINSTTGNVNALAYTKALDKNVPLDGAALQIAKFGKQFPRLLQSTEKIGSTGASYADLWLAMAASAGKTAAGAVTPKGAMAAGVAAARPVARQALMSSAIQKMITRPAPTTRPLSSSLPQLAADAQSNPAMTLAEMSAMANQNGGQ